MNLEQLIELGEKAAKGKWTVGGKCHHEHYYDECNECDGHCESYVIRSSYYVGTLDHDDDAQYIAALSPTELLPLLELLKGLLEKEPRYAIGAYNEFECCAYCEPWFDYAKTKKVFHADSCLWMQGQRYLGDEK